MNVDLTPLASDAIVVLMAALTAFVLVKLVPEVKKLWQPFADKWPMEAVFLEAQADLAVKAAEQTLESKDGKTKLKYALDFMETQARKYGFSFDKAVVQTLVEAKVRDLETAIANSANAKK